MEEIFGSGKIDKAVIEEEVISIDVMETTSEEQNIARRVCSERCFCSHDKGH